MSQTVEELKTQLDSEIKNLRIEIENLKSELENKEKIFKGKIDLNFLLALEISRQKTS